MFRMSSPHGERRRKEEEEDEGNSVDTTLKVTKYLNLRQRSETWMLRRRPLHASSMCLPSWGQSHNKKLFERSSSPSSGGQGPRTGGTLPRSERGARGRVLESVLIWHIYNSFVTHKTCFCLHEHTLPERREDFKPGGEPCGSFSDSHLQGHSWAGRAHLYSHGTRLCWLQPNKQEERWTTAKGTLPTLRSTRLCRFMAVSSPPCPPCPPPPVSLSRQLNVHKSRKTQSGDYQCQLGSSADI